MMSEKKIEKVSIWWRLWGFSKPCLLNFDGKNNFLKYLVLLRKVFLIII